MARASFYYRSHAPDRSALKVRLKDLALTRVRFGYIRLTVLLKREGWPVGKKLVYRLYREMGLAMRSRQGRKMASRSRIPLPAAAAVNERWSMDFVTERMEGGRYFRVLTVMDQFSRECLLLKPAFSLSGAKVPEPGAVGLHPAGETGFKRALAIKEKVLGPEDPDVGQSLNNLAALYRATKREKAAAALEGRAAKIQSVKQ
jgi:putative transposase